MIEHSFQRALLGGHSSLSTGRHSHILDTWSIFCGYQLAFDDMMNDVQSGHGDGTSSMMRAGTSAVG